MTAPIEVVAIRHLDGQTAVKAFVDLKLGGITLKGCKIVQQHGRRAWLALPSTKTNHGWQNVAEFNSKDLRQRTTEIVLTAWEAARQRAEPPPDDPASWSPDARQRHVEQLAAAFEPDEEPPF